MFLNAVVLVLQEFLEAALLLSVLLVFTHLFHKTWDKTIEIRISWVIYSISLGIIGAALYSHYTAQIATWFDYVGQEVVNAGMHILGMIFLLILSYLVPARLSFDRFITRGSLAAICMSGVVLLSIVREGSEIIQYIGGISSQPENFSAVAFGGIIGAGIGVSIGILLFYGLISLNTKLSFRSGLVLLCLIAGNMASQTVLLLTQADWLPFTPIAWDTSEALPEASLIGHLLYSLIGYEATPSILQVALYLFGIIIIAASPLFRKAWPRSQSLAGTSDSYDQG